MVQLLLSLGASLSLADDDGDTALHYSAFGSVNHNVWLFGYFVINYEHTNNNYKLFILETSLILWIYF